MPDFKWGMIAGLLALVLSLALGLVSDVLFSRAIIRALIFAVIFFVGGCGINILFNKYLSDLFSVGSEDGTLSLAGLSAPEAGSRLNITVSDTSDAALPVTARGLDARDDVENISDLLSGKLKPVAKSRARREPQGMDQNEQSGYTEQSFPSVGKQDSAGEVDFGSFQADSNAALGLAAASGNAAAIGAATGAAAFVDSAAFGSDVGAGGGDTFGGLPDLDVLAGSFSGGGGTADQEEMSAVDLPALEGFDGVFSGGKSSNKPKEYEGDFNPKEIAAGIRTVLSKEKQG